MNIKHNKATKTTGKQTARLLTALHDRSQQVFTLADVQAITHLNAALASSLIQKAATRGLVSRLNRGLFTIIPAELGSSTEYAGNPYVVAQRLAGDAPSFISHASAMEIHRMVTQPQLAVFTSSTHRFRNRTVHGTEFRFVLVKERQFFGVQDHWASKQQSIQISDLERTVIDGLRQPEYCGGIADVAKGLWMRHADIDTGKLIGYANRLAVGAVTRRLGHLLELYELASEDKLSALQKSLTATYVPLDPLLPREGPHLRRWRLQLNISPQELVAIRGT